MHDVISLAIWQWPGTIGIETHDVSINSVVCELLVTINSWIIMKVFRYIIIHYLIWPLPEAGRQKLRSYIFMFFLSLVH